MSKARVNRRDLRPLWSWCAVGLLGLAGSACDQPAPRCNISRGAYAARYTLVSGEGDCAGLVGEPLNVQGYNPPRAKDNRPDYDRLIIGIEPQAIYDYVSAAIGTPNPDDQPYGLGEVSTAKAGKDDFCVAPSFSVARLRMDATEEVPNPDMCMPPTPAQDAVDLQYAFSNVRVYNTAADTGTSFSADLTYTDRGCTATYKVVAVYPAVSCAMELPVEDADAGDADAGADDDAGMEPALDDAGCPVPEPTPPMGEIVAADGLCAAAADRTQIGSGISPDYATICDPNTFLCVLASDPPSLK